MSLIDCVNCSQKSKVKTFADGVIYPLRSALNYPRSIEIIDSTTLSVQEAASSCFMRVVYAIVSLIISPFIACALIYKKYDVELTSKRKIIADYVDNVVTALAGKTVDMRDVERNMPLVRSQVSYSKYGMISSRIRQIQANAKPCKEEILFYKCRTKELKELAQRLSQTERSVYSRSIFSLLSQERRFDLSVDRENREAFDRAKKAYNAAKSELRQGVEIRIQRDIARLELSRKEMMAFDFSSATEDYPRPNTHSSIRWGWLGPLNERFKMATLNRSRSDCRSAWDALWARKFRHIKTLEDSLPAIERKTQVYNQIDFDRCPRDVFDDLMSYEPTLLPGYYPEALRQRAQRMQADCLEAKRQFQDRLCALEQEYAEQKRVFIFKTDTFLKRIHDEELRFEDAEAWKEIASLKKALRSHPFYRLCLPEDGDVAVEIQSSKVRMPTCVIIRAQDGSHWAVNALEYAVASPFFKALFFGSFKESEDMKIGRPILLNNISGEQLSYLFNGQLDFGRIEFSSLADLYQTALYLQLPHRIKPLEMKIIGRLLDVDFGAFVALAMRTYSEKLIEHADRYFARKVNRIKQKHANAERDIERCEQQYTTLEIGHSIQSFRLYDKLLRSVDAQLDMLEGALKILEDLKVVIGEQIEEWKGEEPSEQLEIEKTKMRNYIEQIDVLVSSIPLSQRKTRVSDLKTLFSVINKERSRIESARVERARCERAIRERRAREQRDRESWGSVMLPSRNPLVFYPHSLRVPLPLPSTANFWGPPSWQHYG